MFSQLISSISGKKADERFVSVDIGTSAIKLMELDSTASRPRLLSVGLAPTPAGAISNNTLSKPEAVSKVIRSIMEANDITAQKATFGVPGPTAFSKKITIAQMSLKDLRDNIVFEAGNYIPHKIEAVHLDYQVLRNNKGTTMDVLLVAVKNEVVSSYLMALTQAGLEPVIADVDYYALENMFELSYPEERTKTVALINIGARYSSINIMHNGESLFTGDVGVGGRLYTDAMCEALGMQPAQAEQAKAGEMPEGFDENLVHETLDRSTEHVASELHRQLGFFWNAAATDRSIEAVYISGGASQIKGLMDELSIKTGLPCQRIDPFRGLDCSQGFDQEYLQEMAPAMGVSVGLASRRLADKRHSVN